MNIFEHISQENKKETAPLAHKLRPKKLEDILGQEHILAKDKPLYKAIAEDRLRSIILYGPPGTGKTTLAEIIASQTKSAFERINATTSGVKDIKEVVETAKLRLMNSKKTIVFIDEIHRFNKSQQDALLPHVEDGTITIIGATTENPAFEVNKALLSRSIVFTLRNLNETHIKKILEKAISIENISITKTALQKLSEMTLDVRTALNMLELLGKEIDDEAVEQLLSSNPIIYDKTGEEHYNNISAYIKSIRGSDADAAIYYLGRMLAGGEDPKYIARRMVIAASEDIGNADPQGLVIAMAASNAVDFIGMPECRIPLAQATAYLAKAPKCNAAYDAINMAMGDATLPIKSIPVHLKNVAPYEEAKIGYKYPHDYPNAQVEQQYLPDELLHKKYYSPKGL
ncbi:MAG: replication-associated recombination protein A [Defluviitaleaceae bacterium]|nr:replication-associated recombination protein A [Defluviitaleaceae bacterium]